MNIQKLVCLLSLEDGISKPAFMKKTGLLFFIFSCVLKSYSQNIDEQPGTAQTLQINESLQHASMLNNENRTPYALIAGGSKGIGYGIAQALAKRGYNLVLIARHRDTLIAAKNRLESEYPIHVEVLPYDLAKEEAATEIAKWCIDKDIPLKMLCNVAGFGGAEDYLSLPLDTLRYMVRLNVESAMALSLTLLPLLEKNAPSYILNVSSMAGFAPIPEKNMYTATKSAVLFFSYSLRFQLKKKNIHVSCLAPGPVYTKPSIVNETRRLLGGFADKMALGPKKVGEVAVRKTLKGRPVIVPGFYSKILSGLLRIIPKRYSTAIYGRFYAKLDKDKNKDGAVK